MGRPTSIIAAVLVIGMGLSGQVALPAEPSLEEIIARTIRASGGEDRLNALTAFGLKERMKRPEGESTVHQVLVQYPNRYRSDSEITSGGKTRTEILAVDGNQGWSKVGNIVAPLPRESITYYQDEVIPYSGPRAILRLQARRKNPACRFSPAVETTIGGRPAVVVKITVKNGPQEIWSFDKESGLLLKRETRIASFEGTDTVSVILFEDYKEFDGFPLACKTVYKTDGFTNREIEILDFKILKALDDALFAKP